MNWNDIADGARARHLIALGGFHPTTEDALPPDTRTLVMLGPDDADFWPSLTSAPEWPNENPVDTWSERVIGDWSEDIGATALFPFGGPPYLPFYSWATRTGRIHASPIRLLIHDRAGLFVSFRGALALPFHIDLPVPPTSPCATCREKPCLTACPVDAFAGGAYDVPKCKSFLDTEQGGDCMSRGCKARRACPVSQTWGRLDSQSAYHMGRFKG